MTIKEMQATTIVVTDKGFPAYTPTVGRYKKIFFARFLVFCAGFVVLSIAHIEGFEGFWHELMRFLGIALTGLSILGVLDEVFKVKQSELEKETAQVEQWGRTYLTPLVNEWLDGFKLYNHSGDTHNRNSSWGERDATILYFDFKEKMKLAKKGKQRSKDASSAGMWFRIYNENGTDSGMGGSLTISTLHPDTFKLELKVTPHKD